MGSSHLSHMHTTYLLNSISLALPNSLSSPLPPSPPLSCPRLHQMIFTAKCVRVRLTNIRCFFVPYVTQDGVWTGCLLGLNKFFVIHFGRAASGGAVTPELQRATGVGLEALRISACPFFLYVFFLKSEISASPVFLYFLTDFSEPLFPLFFLIFFEIGRLPDLKSDFNSMSDFKSDVSLWETSDVRLDVCRVRKVDVWSEIEGVEETSDLGSDVSHVRFQKGII